MNLKQHSNTAQGRPWLRFMLLGLVAFVWLGRTSEARASCGYYVVIGHPSAEAAAEQAKMRHEQTPLEKKTCPCNGPQCRSGDRPMTPVNAVSVSVQEPMAVSVSDRVSSDINFGRRLIEEVSFLSDPHILLSDPPPRF